MNSENRGDTPEVLVFSVWRRPQAVHRRRVRLDGRYALACYSGAGVAAEAGAGASGGDETDDHAAAQTRDEDDTGAPLALEASDDEHQRPGGNRQEGRQGGHAPEFQPVKTEGQQ